MASTEQASFARRVYPLDPKEVSERSLLSFSR